MYSSVLFTQLINCFTFNNGGVCSSLAVSKLSENLDLKSFGKTFLKYLILFEKIKKKQVNFIFYIISTSMNIKKKSINNFNYVINEYWK